jgi:hypothetical protein
MRSKPISNRPPKLFGHKVAYKGKRYWVIELDCDHSFEGFDVNCGEFVIFDMRDAVVIATGCKMKGGIYHCRLNSHVEISCEAHNIKDAIKASANAMDEYQKVIS